MHFRSRFRMTACSKRRQQSTSAFLLRRFFQLLIVMPNLTSYRPPAIHLKRELPKTYCDLMRHEVDYTRFLRTRVKSIRSTLSSTNRKYSLVKPVRSQRPCFDHNQRLFFVYQRNLQLCRKILGIWTSDGPQQGGVDCHNEDYQKRTKISHFRLRQGKWKEAVERENHRFSRSLA